ncbi:MAG: hypothetical protein HKM07_05380 [Chlamydiae bacterium]|nr:hypothetical protein [Chlamydiota bacterium]
MNYSFHHPGPPQPTPEQRLLLMNDVEWEAFIETCVRQLQTEGEYTQVIRLGGAGDKGRDVCGYRQCHAIEGTWDLYQAKYSANNSLSPSKFASELAKFLSNVHEGEYTCPHAYYICALKFTPKLHDLVMNVNKMGDWILELWKKNEGKFDSFSKKLNSKLEKFVEKFDYKIIKIKTAATLLEIHNRSNKHWERFGVLEQRGTNPEMSVIPTYEEQVYIAALLKVYAETSEIQIKTPNEIPNQLAKHFIAQRQLFYCAEGLNRFSRDKLPGAFNELLSQVDIGIASVVNTPQPNGMTRLKETLTLANTLQVTSNPLASRLQAGDLQGTCHHLANQQRITWVNENE